MAEAEVLEAGEGAEGVEEGLEGPRAPVGPLHLAEVGGQDEAGAEVDGVQNERLHPLEAGHGGEGETGPEEVRPVRPNGECGEARHELVHHVQGDLEGLPFPCPPCGTVS